MYLYTWWWFFFYSVCSYTISILVSSQHCPEYDREALTGHALHEEWGLLVQSHPKHWDFPGKEKCLWASKGFEWPYNLRNKDSARPKLDQGKHASYFLIFHRSLISSCPIPPSRLLLKIALHKQVSESLFSYGRAYEYVVCETKHRQ